MTRRSLNRTACRGVILLLTCFLMVLMLGMAAFAVDLGYVLTVQTEMRRAVDAAAAAAAWDLYDSTLPGSTITPATGINTARGTAVNYVAANRVDGGNAVVDLNADNAPTGDIVIGYLSNVSQPTAEMSYLNQADFNAVKVTLSKSATKNGEISFFFARVFERAGIGSTSSATAAFINNFGGFGTPSDGSNIEILPFALDEDTWNQLLAGNGTDNSKWDSHCEEVRSGSDGILEVNLYPQGTGSPGNRGTVDIGSSNNSTNDLSRQILHGISPADLEHHGGSLQFNAQGTLSLNGDTGISAGIKDELASIIGQKRIIPIFQSVSGPGNNAQYVITKFAGVRIMEVVLTGKMTSKRLMVQPAAITTIGGIPADGPKKSYAIYSPVRLVH